jgi:hypothetical protein
VNGQDVVHDSLKVGEVMFGPQMISSNMAFQIGYLHQPKGIAMARFWTGAMPMPTNNQAKSRMPGNL